jgi:hypothetical protein
MTCFLLAFCTYSKHNVKTPRPGNPNVRPLSHIYAIMIDDARPTPATSTLTLPHR